MKIFSRLADLLKANINDLIDRAEDPEKMVKQIIIDMEEQLQRAVQGLGTVMASEREMEKQLNKSKEESGMWEKRAKDALESGDEDLAKKALARKLDADADGIPDAFENADQQDPSNPYDNIFNVAWSLCEDCLVEDTKTVRVIVYWRVKGEPQTIDFFGLIPRS